MYWNMNVNDMKINNFIINFFLTLTTHTQHIKLVYNRANLSVDNFNIMIANYTIIKVFLFYDGSIGYRYFARTLHF